MRWELFFTMQHDPAARIRSQANQTIDPSREVDDGGKSFVENLRHVFLLIREKNEDGAPRLL